MSKNLYTGEFKLVYGYDKKWHASILISGGADTKEQPYLLTSYGPEFEHPYAKKTKGSKTPQEAVSLLCDWLQKVDFK